MDIYKPGGNTPGLQQSFSKTIILKQTDLRGCNNGSVRVYKYVGMLVFQYASKQVCESEIFYASMQV
jgi:hypothetical protein